MVNEKSLGGDMKMLESLYEKAKREIPHIAELAVMYPSIKMHEDKDTALQVLMMRLAEQITFRKNLSAIYNLVSYLATKCKRERDEFHSGFFWALERLFFVLKAQPFSEEVLERWVKKGEELVKKYGNQ